MKEAVTTIIGLAVVLGVLWGVSAFFVKIVGPRRARKGIFKALEDAERIGASDVHSNIKAATKRCIELKRGVSRCAELKLEPYLPRIKHQLEVLAPYEAQMAEQEQKFRNRDATISNIGDVLNLIP